MFSLHISNDAGLVEPLVASLKDVPSRLEARVVSSPAEYTAILKAKEDSYNQGMFTFYIISLPCRARTETS